MGFNYAQPPVAERSRSINFKNMKWLKKILNDIRGSEEFSDITSSSLRDVMNGNILTKKYVKKHYGLAVLLAVLGFFYIGNRYHSENLMKEENRLRTKLKETKDESLNRSADLMKISRRSNVLQMLENRGIKLIESTEPPIRID
jgi:hypothetical protein